MWLILNMRDFRLFVGNIPLNTSEGELQSEFGAYGNVHNIEIKSKGDDNVFAFINLETDEHMVNQCVREFEQHKFKGVFLNVSKAKESFLDRLKREREEAERRKALREQQNSYDERPNHTRPAQASGAELPKFNIDEKAVSSGSEDEDEHVLTAPKAKTLAPQEFDEIVKKFNSAKRKFDHVEAAPTVFKPPKVLDPDEEKRLKGLDSLKNAYDNQKKLIQNALSSAEGTIANKKIVFDNGEDDPETGNRLTLFDDDDDTDLVGYKKSFEVKKQFQGEKGEELFHLQSKFKSDSRFSMGPEFLDNSGAATNQASKSRDKKKKLTAAEKERDAQLRLLQDMGANVGVQQVGGKGKQERVAMVRFDPSKPDHGKYTKKGEALQEGQTGGNAAPREEFQVSDDRYVKVNTDLKQALQHSGEFSLLQMFGKPTAVVEEVEPAADQEGAPFSGKRFHYDSSDDERADKAGPEDAEAKQAAKPGDVKKRKAKIFHQKFFFYLDDERLKDGLRFFTAKVDRKSSEDLAEARKNLKQIVKQKIKKQSLMQLRREVHVRSFKKSFTGRKGNGRPFNKPTKNFTRK